MDLENLLDHRDWKRNFLFMFYKSQGFAMASPVLYIIPP